MHTVEYIDMTDSPQFGALTFDQLRLLVTVADEGSFSAAGRRLHRVQSAVSYGIANLEELLGLRLFDRTGRRPVLTDAGRALLFDARQVLARVGQLESRAAAFSTGIEAEVSLAVDAIFPASKLIAICRAFQREFPAVSLRLHTDVLEGVAARVRSGECTMGITGVSAEGSAGLERRFLTHVELVPVAAADHSLAQHDGALSDAELREAVQIVISQTSSPLAAETSEARHVLSERIWRVADASTKLELIRAGLGWGNLSPEGVHDDLERGSLRRLMLASWGPKPPTGTLVTLTRTDAPPGPAGRWLLDALPALAAAPIADDPPPHRDDVGPSS